MRLLLLFCLFSLFSTFAKDPEPPTQQWCEWAFQQIPDCKALTDVNPGAFTGGFFHQMKKVERQTQRMADLHDEGMEGDYLLRLWYSSLDGSPFDGGAVSVSFFFAATSAHSGEMSIVLHHPNNRNTTAEYSRHTMFLVYQSRAWRINDWDTKRKEFLAYLQATKKMPALQQKQ